MLQKIIWMRYLIIGLISAFTSCSKGSIDYVVKADFIYINNTTHFIKLISSETIKPNGTLKITLEGDGEKSITETSYVPPYPFEAGTTLKYDNVRCDILKAGLKAGEGEGPAGIQNYKWKKISERYYEFTYHFTEEDYNQSENCK